MCVKTTRRCSRERWCHGARNQLMKPSMDCLRSVSVEIGSFQEVLGVELTAKCGGRDSSILEL